MRTHKIPATVVTGFLGAGKTTLVRHLLTNAGGRRIALLINEFGDLGVDSEVLRGCGIAACEEDDVVELTNGCICCTVADDFVPTMTRLVERADPPDHIVIETSGLALPQPLVQAFNWPGIRERVTVDGVITVVDAAAVADGRFAAVPSAVDAQRRADPALDHEAPLEELYEDQLVAADLVVLNKCDLLQDERLAGVRADAARHTGARIVTAQHGVLPLEVIIGLGASTETLIAERPSHHERHHAGEPHDHDEFASFVVDVPPIADAVAFEGSLREVLARHDILRAKGFLDVAGRPLRRVVQAVGPRIDGHFDQPWGARERRGRLVVIALAGVDEAAVRREILAPSQEPVGA